MTLGIMPLLIFCFVVAAAGVGYWGGRRDALAQTPPPPVREDIIDAVAYCRVGGGRPVDDRVFDEAKALGLLAQDSCWRATARGEGLLVAAGRLKGEPAPRRTSLCVMWAVCERYPTPQFVGAWPEHTWESMDADEVERHQTAFIDWGNEQAWRFFETWEHIDQPKVPEEAVNV